MGLQGSITLALQVPYVFFRSSVAILLCVGLLQAIVSGGSHVDIPVWETAVDLIIQSDRTFCRFWMHVLVARPGKQAREQEPRRLNLPSLKLQSGYPCLTVNRVKPVID